MARLKRAALIAALVTLYLATVVPIGLLVHEFKTDIGFDIFRTGGMTAFGHCLRSSFPLEKRSPLTQVERPRSTSI
ncbi:MAG: hypothetical protein Q8M07_24225 [Prosthecobacter sp.]|nr:hypothetical protein [Prosthecobacter sp.]